MSRLNHSRYISYGTKEAADREYWRARQTPTAKQKKFFVRLVMMCKNHELDTGTGFAMNSRADYSMGIDVLIERLKAAGVSWGKQDKEVTYVISHGSDKAGNYYTHETMEVAEK